jgi:hypothetical protein
VEPLNLSALPHDGLVLVDTAPIVYVLKRTRSSRGGSAAVRPPVGGGHPVRSDDHDDRRVLTGPLAAGEKRSQSAIAP